VNSKNRSQRCAVAACKDFPEEPTHYERAAARKSSHKMAIPRRFQLQPIRKVGARRVANGSE